jgi:hypothetical protein
VAPLLVVSVYLVKYRHQFALHKKLQLAMAAVLLVRPQGLFGIR